MSLNVGTTCKPNDNSINYFGKCYTPPGDSRSYKHNGAGLWVESCNSTWKNSGAVASHNPIDSGEFPGRDDGTGCWFDADTIWDGTSVDADMNCNGKPDTPHLVGNKCYSSKNTSYSNASPTVVPNYCPAGQEFYGSGCYKACPAGHRRTAVCTCESNNFTSYTWGSTGCTGPKQQPTYSWGSVNCRSGANKPVCGLFGCGKGYGYNDCYLTGYNDCYGWKSLKTDCGAYGYAQYPDCGGAYPHKAGALCYKACPTGYYNNGLECVAVSSAPNYDCSKYPNSSISGSKCAHPSCALAALDRKKNRYDQYYKTAVGTCQRDPSVKYKRIPSVVDSGSKYDPYGSCDYPISTPKDNIKTSYQLIDLGDLDLGGQIEFSKGCSSGDVPLPDITFPNNQEFALAKGAGCGRCKDCNDGRECGGAKDAPGFRPAIKRVDYKGDPTNCCKTGDKFDGGLTCAPKYRSGASAKSAACIADADQSELTAYCNTNFNTSAECRDIYGKTAFMDNYCDDPGRYAATDQCRADYIQYPKAAKYLTDFGDFGTCSKDCGTGARTRSRQCMVKPSGAVKALKKSNVSYFDGAPNDMLYTEDMEKKYYFIQDECSKDGARLALSETEQCNTESCAAYYIKTNIYVQLLIFILLVAGVYGLTLVPKIREIVGIVSKG